MNANIQPSREAVKRHKREAMLNGPVFKTMMRLALPTIGVLVAQTLVSVAETYYVSFLGTSALVGVSMVFPLWMLMTMMAAGGIGGGVAIKQTGALYLQVVAPLYVANAIVFALGFAAQGSGHMWRIFLAGTVRLSIAAGGGWLAVSAFGASLETLFIIVLSGMVISAVICVVTELSGAMWPRTSHGDSAKTQLA